MSEEGLIGDGDCDRTARDAFRLALADVLRTEVEPAELRASVCRLIGRHFRASRVLCVRADASDYVIEHAYSRGVAPLTTGRFPQSEWGQVETELGQGGIRVVEDTRAEGAVPEHLRPLYVRAEVGSFAAVPLRTRGRWAGVFVVQQRTAHRWARDELDLLVESAERVWAAVERLETERELARTAARDAYRVRLADALRDARDPAAMYETVTRMIGDYLAVSRVVFAHRDGEEWVVDQEYGPREVPVGARIAVAELPAQIEEAVRSGDVVVIPDTFADASVASAAHARRIRERALVAVPRRIRDRAVLKLLLITHDAPRPWRADEMELIVETAERVWAARETARSEHELARRATRDAYRVRLADAMRGLVDATALRQAALRVLGEQLRAHRTSYVRLDGGDYVIENDWCVGVKSIVGRRPIASFGEPIRDILISGDNLVFSDAETDPRLTPEVRAMLRSIDARANISVPLVRAGQWLGGVGVHSIVPRVWTADELEIVEETAERMFLAVERARAEQELRQAAHELREADRRKDEFIALLSHELRGPLTPMRAAVEILRIAGDQPAVVDDARAMMERQVAHMTRLVDDLLDAGRITRGVITLRRETVPLGEIVTTAVEANRSALDVARLALVTRLPSETCLLDVDRTRIVQVLSNLLHNASKFTPRGGRITVTASVQGNELTVVVGDTGVGIDPDLLPRVFELFVQGEPASSAQGGLGIGLSLAKSIVELHGGRIEARSAGRGSGTEIELRLPCVVHAPAPAASPPERPSASTPPTVVVIDDNVDGATALAYLVRVLGGVTHVAYSGEAGLEQIRAVQPDVVLLDIGMPNLDGYETCSRIRQLVGHGITIIAVSGWGKDEDKARAAAAGFDAHITKPPDPAVLRRYLRL